MIGLIAVLAQRSAPAQVSMYTAIDLALRNSPQVRSSVELVRRAQAGVSADVDLYKPNLTLGSSLGYSYGFPIGQPEVFSLTAQSLAFSFSQPDYIRSARKALESAQLSLADTRQQVVLDTASDYIELAKVNQQLAALDQESGYVEKLVEIEDERVDAGRDPRIELTQARLTGAQVALKRLQLADQSDLLRARLAHLTGLAAADMTPLPKSIPEAPVQEGILNPDSSVMTSSASVRAAYASAQSKLYTAFGDSRQNNRPVISFVATYGLFSNFNNYSQYYKSFQANNFGAGLQVTIPFFDTSATAKARGSSADAAHSLADADQLRDQQSEQLLQLQKSIAELAAQVKVAGLESELAQDQLAQVTTELQSGSGSQNQTPLTPKDQQQAEIDERSRFVDTLDARFELTKAELNLMRSTGTIERWAQTLPQSPAPAKP